MKIVNFYYNGGRTHTGDTYDIIMQMSDDWWEWDHDYIQYLFPNEIPSQMNGSSPVLTAEEAKIFQANVELQEKVERAFFRFLDFLGMEKVLEESHVVIKPSPKADWWSMRFNHTMLRITRILKALRLTGLSEHSRAFHSGLMLFKDRFDPSTLKYWKDATFGTLDYVND